MLRQSVEQDAILKCMWSLGIPYLEDVLCMGMVEKLLNRCVKKVCNQMISHLFVFCKPVAMQV